MSVTWRWFQATAIGPVAAGAAMGITVAHRVGPGQRDLERDHAAERAADDEVETLDPEGIEQPPLRPRLVAGRDRREGGPVRPARARVERGRAGRAVPAAEQVRGDDADARPCRAPGPGR